MKNNHTLEEFQDFSRSFSLPGKNPLPKQSHQKVFELSKFSNSLWSDRPEPHSIDFRLLTSLQALFLKRLSQKNFSLFTWFSHRPARISKNSQKTLQIPTMIVLKRDECNLSHDQFYLIRLCLILKIFDFSRPLVNGIYPVFITLKIPKTWFFLNHPSSSSKGVNSIKNSTYTAVS